MNNDNSFPLVPVHASKSCLLPLYSSHRRRRLSAAVGLFALCCALPSAFAQQFQAELTVDAPVFNRPLLPGDSSSEPADYDATWVVEEGVWMSGARTGGTLLVHGENFKYFQHYIVPSATGSYSIEVLEGSSVDDSSLFLYSGSFDPVSPLTNLLAGNDDQDSENEVLRSRLELPSLQAGATYVLVLTSYGSDDAGIIYFKAQGAGMLADSASPPANTPPSATSVAISGSLSEGSTLTGSYDYFDPNANPESGSTFRWYRSEDALGTGKAVIVGATGKTYTLTAEDVGMYISFEVTPNDGSAPGTPAESESYLVPLLLSAPTLTADAIDPTFVENGPAVALFNNVSAATNDADQTFSALTITVSNVSDGADEALYIGGTSVALEHGNGGPILGIGTFAVTVSDGTATVTLSGMARSDAQMNSLIEGLSYHNASDDPGSNARVVTLISIVDSGGIANSATPGIDSIVSITAANDAPQATNLNQTISVTEDSLGTDLDDIVVSDPDGDDTITATLTLSEIGAGSLSTGTHGSATSTFAAASGVWTVSGSVADVNAALAAVAFVPAADRDQDLSISTRIRDAADSGPADGSITLNLIAVNDAPTAVTLSSYSVGESLATSGATLATLSAIDVDDSSFTFSLVSTGAGGAGTCFSDADNAKFEIDGTSLKAAEDLAVGSYVLCILADDDEATYKTSLPLDVTDDQAPAVLSVSVPPDGYYKAGDTLAFSLTTSEPVTLTGAPKLDLTIGSDQVSATLTGHSATVFNFGYTVQAEDTDGDGISVDALDLDGATMVDSAGNALVATLVGVADSSGVRVDTDAPAATASTPAAAEAHASTVVFTVTFDEAVTGVDADSFVLTSTGHVTANVSNVTVNGLTSATVTVSGIGGVGTIRVDLKGNAVFDAAGNPAPGFTGGATHRVNTAPALSLDDSDLVYTEGADAIAIDPAASLSDPNGDSDWWNGGTLSVQITANSESTDEISLLDDDEDDILISVDGTVLLADGIPVGTLSSAEGIVDGDTALTISFTGTSASDAIVQEVLQSLRFRSNSANPGTAARVITITATDRNGHSASAERNLTISTSNDAPSLSGLPASLGFTEDTAGNFDLSGVTLSDADSSSATLTLVASAGSFSATSAGGVTVSGSGGSTLILSGDIADINSYLDSAASIQYLGALNAEGSNAASVSVSLADADGSGDVAVGSIQVDISGVDDPAVITGSFSGSVTEGNLGDVASTSGSIAISDVDLGDDPIFADLSATAGDQAYGSFSLSAGTWTYVLDQSAVQHLKAGQTVTDSLTFTASDGSSQVVTVTITGTADAPVISDLDATVDYPRGSTGPLALDHGTPVSLSDFDSSDFNGGSLRLSLGAGSDPEEDVLAFAPLLFVTVGGSVAGSVVSVEGVAVGTLGEDLALGNDLVIHLNADATPARVARLLQAVAYFNIDFASPTLGQRTVEVTLTGDGSTVTYSVLVNVYIPAPPSSGGSGGVIDKYTPNPGGVINNPVITPNGTVEGGTLGGTVRNGGTVRDVELRPGTRVEGGTLSGSIKGSPESPARLNNATIRGDAELSNVIISQTTVLEPGVKIGQNVKFETNASIPGGLDLTDALPMINWSDADRRGVVGLDTDVVAPLDGSDPMTLIRSIQLLGEYEPAGNSVTQESNGELLIITADSSSALLPVKVSKARDDEPEGTYINEDGDIVFVTVNRRVVLAYPALQDKPGLVAALASYGLVLNYDERANLIAGAPGSSAALLYDGSMGRQALALEVEDSGYYAARPEASALPAPAGMEPGVHYARIPGLPGSNLLKLVFRDAEGALMVQDVVPVPADWELMKASLQGQGFDEVRIDGQGIISVRYKGILIQGRSEYRVNGGAIDLAEADRVAFVPAGDLDGNGTDDFLMVFPNGDSQRLFILPELP